MEIKTETKILRMIKISVLLRGSIITEDFDKIDPVSSHLNSYIFPVCRSFKHKSLFLVFFQLQRQRGNSRHSATPDDMKFKGHDTVVNWEDCSNYTRSWKFLTD